MSQTKNSHLITSFSNNRDRYKSSLLDWIDRVDQWVDSTDLDLLTAHFEKWYHLSPDAVRQHLKRTISNWYDFTECRFSRPVAFENTAKSILWYIAAFGYVVAYSTQKLNKPIKGRLLIDEIENSEYELGAFSKLIANADFKILFATINKKEAAQRSDLFLSIDKKKYARSLVLHTLKIELLHGIKLYRPLSKKLGIDVFRLAFSVLNKYLYYESLFEQLKVDYCLSWRDYGSFSIKKDVFKRKGGKAICAVQRSAHKYRVQSAFIDLDIYFSLGEWFGDFLQKMKGKFGKVEPIGSLLCDLHLSGKANQQKEYDIFWADVPMLQDHDLYNNYRKDQITTYEWLARFAEENPALKIVIKTRSDTPMYRLCKEAHALLSTLPNVSILDSKENSYDLASLSHVVATYYSTMGYELMGFGVPTVFSDPTQQHIFVPDHEQFEPYCASCYEDFSARLLFLLGAREGEVDSYKNNFAYFYRSPNQAYKVMLRVFGKERESLQYNSLAVGEKK